MTSANAPADSPASADSSGSAPAHPSAGASPGSWDADAQPDRKAQRAKRRSMGLSAAGIVAASALLWVIVAVVTTLAVLLLRHITFSNQRVGEVAGGLFFVPSVILGVYAWALTMVGGVRWAVYGAGARGVGQANQPEVLGLLRTMSQRLLVSETAKRIAFRGEDIEVLRQTIRQDINKKEYEAALVLVQELADTYGQVEEAESYRENILQARDAMVDAKVTEAEQKIDAMLEKQDFDSAQRAAARLQRVHGDHTQRPRRIGQKVAAARDQYKQDIEREFLTAAKREDVDRAMELLKELDKYLTEREAEPYRETARGVIGKQRENLAVQFKLAVQDKEWVRANTVGQQIIREFPNTRMADEVRGMLDLLRERAAGQNAAAAREPG